MGGINWDNTWIGVALGGHVRAVFTIITIIFIVCVSYTITSFIEMPLSLLEGESYQAPDFDDEKIPMNDRPDQAAQPSETDGLQKTENSYGALDNNAQETSFNPFTAQEQQPEPEATRPQPPSRPRRPNMLIPEQPYDNIDGENVAETSFGNQQQQQMPGQGVSEAASLQHYLMSIVFMPHSMRMVCMTNLFCWMAHVCYSLYFTDFVGEAVFGGDPKVN
jgi:solute carrier family 45, member 1/2/4